MPALGGRLAAQPPVPGYTCTVQYPASTMQCPAAPLTLAVSREKLRRQTYCVREDLQAVGQPRGNGGQRLSEGLAGRRAGRHRPGRRGAGPSGRVLAKTVPSPRSWYAARATQLGGWQRQCSDLCRTVAAQALPSRHCWLGAANQVLPARHCRAGAAGQGRQGQWWRHAPCSTQ